MRQAHVPNATLAVSEVIAAPFRRARIETFERRLSEQIDRHVVAFASARGALAASVAALAPARAVAVPAYTCIAVSNAVCTAGSTPRYADVDRRGLVPADGWPDAAAVIAQDTYGFASQPPGSDVVIHDMAHCADRLTNTRAAVAITSFEQSKWVSAGGGGLAVTRDAELAVALRSWRDRWGVSSPASRHALTTLLILLMGRAAFAGRRPTARLLTRIVRLLDADRLAGQSAEERHGGGVDRRLLGRPNRVMLALMRSQLDKLDVIRRHRAGLVALYDRMARLDRKAEPLVRYPMAVPDPAEFEARLSEVGWNVRGRWFNAPLHPATSAEVQRKLGYEPGSAPMAERLAGTVVNLPTHPLVHRELATALMRAALRAGARPLE